MDDLKFSEILASNATVAPSVAASKVFRIKILSNITVNQGADVLLYALRREGVNAQITLGNYDNIVQDSAQSHDEHMVLIVYDLLNVVENQSIFIEHMSPDQLAALAMRIKAELGLALGNLRHCPSIVINSFSTLGTFPAARYSTRAGELCAMLNNYLLGLDRPGLHILNLDQLIARVGVGSSFDFRMFNSSKSLYTVGFWKVYCDEFSPIVMQYCGKLKKILVFDCDNTLWGGILGEAGFDGIEMSADTHRGEIFRSVQKMAKYLSQNGVLIGLCSKNNPQDVEQVVANHPEMLLRADDIAISKINWHDKASNLRQVAQQLNIGLDSIVFVDDSDFEINLVREQIPEIVTFQVPKRIENYPWELMRIVNRYFSRAATAEDLAKTEQYKQQAARAEQQESFSDLEGYLRSLDLRIEVSCDNISQSERTAQLTQKTNQFNLTTRRYTQSQILDLIDNPQSSVYSISVEDRFGQSGLTGVCITTRYGDQPRECHIEAFLLSCRVMGRNVEYAMLNAVMQAERERGANVFRGSYIPTAKNIPVAQFYVKAGFQPGTTRSQSAQANLHLETEQKEYLFSGNGSCAVSVPYIEIINNQHK